MKTTQAEKGRTFSPTFSLHFLVLLGDVSSGGTKVELARHSRNPGPCIQRISPESWYTLRYMTAKGRLAHLLYPGTAQLAVILVLALLVRLAFLVAIAHPEATSGAFSFPTGSDEADYHQMAIHLAESGVYKLQADGPPTAKRPPGMILPMALLYKLLGPSPWWAVTWVVCCSLLIIPVAGELARITDGRPAAILAARLLAAFLPTLLFTSAGIWSDPPALLFTLLSLLILLRALPKPDVGRLLLAGLALAAAYLNRPSAGLVIALVALLLAWHAVHGRNLRPWVAFLFAAGLPILAWGLRNHHVFGEFFLGNTESTAALWGSNNPVSAGLQPPALDEINGIDLRAEQASGAWKGSWIPLHYIPGGEAPPGTPELERHHWYQQQVRTFVRQHPWAFIDLVAHKVLRIFTAEPMPPSVLAEAPKKRLLKRLVTLAERWLVLLLGGWGLWYLGRQRHPHLPPYGIYLLGGLAVVVIAYVNARIFLPVTGALLVPAAVGVAEMFERLFPALANPRERIP